jgi:hypothetical protein
MQDRETRSQSGDVPDEADSRSVEVLLSPVSPNHIAWIRAHLLRNLHRYFKPHRDDSLRSASLEHLHLQDIGAGIRYPEFYMSLMATIDIAG